MIRSIQAFAVAGALVAATALTAAPTLAQQVTLKLHVFIPPPANPYKTFLKPWADKVAKESNGKLKIELYPSSSLAANHRSSSTR